MSIPFLHLSIVDWIALKKCRHSSAWEDGVESLANCATGGPTEAQQMRPLNLRSISGADYHRRMNQQGHRPDHCRWQSSGLNSAADDQGWWSSEPVTNFKHAWVKNEHPPPQLGQEMQWSTSIPRRKIIHARVTSFSHVCRRSQNEFIHFDIFMHFTEPVRRACPGRWSMAHCAHPTQGAKRTARCGQGETNQR